MLGERFPISGEGPVSNSNEASPPGVASGAGLGRLGDYELLEEISRGGMGVVYKARQASLGRVVALKMILAGQWANEKEIERFRREAEAVAKLDHPNIVPVYAVGEHEGRHFFSMKFIEGQSLAARMGSFRADLRLAVTVMITVAHAVEHAHQRGILHRDLKPSNILLDKEGQPHVADFGLAKWGQDSSLTLSAGAVGTPGYMAPEQAEGNTEQVTTASDVFSLGAILYQMLTGQAAFAGDTPLAVARRVAENEPVRPRLLNELVDRDLETICLKCLEKEPARRYRTATALAEELQRWERGEPVQARFIGTAGRVVKWARRRPTVAALWAALLVLALGSVVGYQLTQSRTQRELRISLARALVREGDALVGSHDVTLAQNRILEARSNFLAVGQSTLSADLSLLDLYRFSPPPVLTLQGNQGAVTCVAVSPDKRQVVSGGADGTICVWSLPLGRLEQRTLAHVGGVTCLAVCGSGAGGSGSRGLAALGSNLPPTGLGASQFCVSGGADGKIRICRLDDIEVATSITLNEPVRALAISNKGDLCAAAGISGKVEIWRMGFRSGSSRTGADWPPKVKKMEELRWDTNGIAIDNLSFSPSGGKLLAGSRKGCFVWNFQGATNALKRYDIWRPGAYSVFSPDGKLFGCGAGDGMLWVRKADGAKTGEALLRFPVTAMAATSDTWVCGTAEGTIACFTPNQGAPVAIAMLSAHDGPVRSLGAASDGTLVASGGEDGFVRVWGPIPGEDAPEVPDNGLTVLRIIYSPDGLLFLTAGQGGQLRLRDAATGHVLVGYEGHVEDVCDAAFSPDGNRVASVGDDGTLKTWDRDTGRLVWTNTISQTPVWRVAWSPDGKLIAAGDGFVATHGKALAGAENDHPAEVHVYSAGTGDEVFRRAAHNYGVSNLCFSADGKRLLSTGGDGRIRGWITTDWQEARCFEPETNGLTGIALVGHGAFCVTTYRGRQLAVHDTSSGRVLRELPVSSELGACELHNGWQALIGGMSCGDIQVWDLGTGTELHSFRAATSLGVPVLGVSPDGRNMVSAETGSLEARRWDFERAVRFPILAGRAASAQTALQRNPADPAALLDLARWYAFRGMWGWAAELCTQVEAAGGRVPVLLAARCCWQDGRLDEALRWFEKAARQEEAPEYYLRLCQGAISETIMRQATIPESGPPPVPARSVVIEEDSTNSLDVYTTSVFFGGDDDSQGGGSADRFLRIGGWHDLYYSLLQFDLTKGPVNARSAFLCLYCASLSGGGTPIFLDQVEGPWDWRRTGTGPDHSKLWWRDCPPAHQLSWEPTPSPGRWYQIEITDLYNSWKSGACPNYGVQMRPEFSYNNKFDNFYSSRFTNAVLRPKLLVVP